MKYKVGDKVRIRSKEWYESHKNKFGKIWTVCLSGEGIICFDQDNAKYCGKEVTIFSVEPDNYVLRGIPYKWTDEMIEGLVEEPTVFNGEEFLLKLANIELPNGSTTIWECPDGYIFKDENGNVISATKIVLEKKKKEYPKTYEECCKVLGCKADDFFTDFSYNNGDVEISDYEDKIDDLLQNFRKLRYCRDAYWKIAGEEMGLGTPWEPDWSDDNAKYSIYTIKGVLTKAISCYDGAIFVFPTEEMRDVFHENFKELIEQCKELL